MKKGYILILIIISLAACQMENNELSANANETIYVESNGQSMRVNIRGNTLSQTMLLVVHGGPGGGAFDYRDEAMKKIFEKDYAVAYWDQRAAGSSQGAVMPRLMIGEYGTDMIKVIQVLKHKYPNTKIFIYGQSWGGIVISEFLSNRENEEMVQGIVYATAAYSFPLQDSLIRPMIIDYGTQEINAGRSVDEWTPMVDYCREKLGTEIDLDQAAQLNRYAFQAMELIKKVDGKVYPFSQSNIALALEENMPITAYYISVLNSSDFAYETSKLDYRGKVEYITKPILVITAKYDFPVPPDQGLELYNTVQSTQKHYLELERSTHNMEERDAHTIALRDFVSQYR